MILDQSKVSGPLIRISSPNGSDPDPEIFRVELGLGLSQADSNTSEGPVQHIRVSKRLPGSDSVLGIRGELGLNYI